VLPAVRHACPVVAHKFGVEALPEKGSVISGAGVEPLEPAASALATLASNRKKPIAQTRKLRITAPVLTLL
jgi:hypothetical protein